MRIQPVISSSALSHLDCARCHHRASADDIQTVCPTCGGPLFARYELSRADLRGLPWDLPQRSSDLWRYAELLPVRTRHFRIGLGEGMTPLLEVPRLGHALGLETLWIKDEGRNPTGSFKARGMAVAVARAAELGVPSLATPSAGNAGLALAAYAARHNLPAIIAFPEDIPHPYITGARDCGAEVLVVGATIREAGAALLQRIKKDPKWAGVFDLSTLREPYRLEGKKTMGYEIVEQSSNLCPDAIIYPTGGGTGLIGIAKAYEEMASLGWIEECAAPRMISVQMEGCCPIVDAFQRQADCSEPVEHPETQCWGLRVPSPFADQEILTTLRSTKGDAIAVPEHELKSTANLASRLEGMDLCPEGAAAAASIPHLLERGSLAKGDRVVVLNTASSALSQ